MQTYVVTHDEVLVLLQGLALIALCIVVLAPLVLQFLGRWVDLLFDSFQVRMRFARRKNPRYVLDSYRYWVTYRNINREGLRYRRFEPS